MNPPVTIPPQAELAPSVKMAILGVELVVLIMIGGLAAQFMFSLLPLSAALLTWVFSVATFPVLRRKIDGATHVCWTIAFWLVFALLLYFAISIFGRGPFEWLLDWN